MIPKKQNTRNFILWKNKMIEKRKCRKCSKKKTNKYFLVLSHH